MGDRKADPIQTPIVRAVIAAGALFYVMKLSAGDRGPLDFAVIGVVVLALVWYLYRVVSIIRRG